MIDEAAPLRKCLLENDENALTATVFVYRLRTGLYREYYLNSAIHKNNASISAAASAGGSFRVRFLVGDTGVGFATIGQKEPAGYRKTGICPY